LAFFTLLNDFFTPKKKSALSIFYHLPLCDKNQTKIKNQFLTTFFP